MKFVRYTISVWLVEPKENNELTGISKMECVDLEDDDFNEFVNGKLNIIKNLINEL